MAVRTTNRQVEFVAWPTSPTTTVTNTGLGGASYDGVEVANHYAIFGSQTAQGITTNNEAIIVPAGAAIDTPAALTMEWLFRYDASTNASFFGKGTQYYATYNAVQFTFWRKAVAGVQFFQCYFTLTAGHWYDLQVSWGTTSSTPICKLNNVAQTITYVLKRTGAWADDSDYDLKIMNNSWQGGALRSTIEVFRFYNAALSDAELQANYAVDNARLLQVVAWEQDGSTYKVPNVGVNDVALDSIVGIDNAWHEGMPEPDVGAVALTPTGTVLTNEFNIGGNATAQAYTPSVVAARFPDVPPPTTVEFTPAIRGKFTFSPIVGEG